MQNIFVKITKLLGSKTLRASLESKNEYKKRGEEREPAALFHP